MIFTVKYYKGSMSIDVAEFFATATDRNIKKWLKFAIVNCSYEQRQELLDSIKSEHRKCQDVLSRLADLERQRMALMQENFPTIETTALITPDETTLKKRMLKFERVIEYLKNEYEVG